MGLRDLTTASMVTVTAALIDPERERSIIEKYPRLLPWLEDIEAAHRGLYETQTRAPSPELAAMNEQATALDAEHDRRARGLYAVIEGLVELSDDADEASRLGELHEQLFPAGRSITKRTYLDQAGEAQLLESRLSERSRRLLGEVMVHGIALGKHVHAWQKTAIELGQLEADRVRLAKDEKAQVLTTLGKARSAWVSAMNSLLFVLDREKTLTDQDRRRLLEPLETALSKIAAKKKARAKGAEPESEVGGEVVTE